MDLDLARIAEAAHVIDPVFLHTPQYVDEGLSRALGRTVVVKLETANPIRSFKGRGADFALSTLEPGTRVLCASTGNFGQAVAYAGRARGLRVDVFTPHEVNPEKRARMEALGAHVTPAGSDNSAIREAAAGFAADHPEVAYVRDGYQPAVAEGAGTIGVELAREDAFDAVVLPIGDGALVTGVARWLREHMPGTRIVGVNAAGAPAMHDSLRAGRPVTIDHADTFADGMSVRTPLEESLRRVAALVDDIVLVDDAAIADAMELAARTVGVLLEPAGAAGLAAIARRLVPGDRMATVLTGANPRPEVLRSLAARVSDPATG